MEAEFITKDNMDKTWEYINSVHTDTAKIFYLHFILNMTFNQISRELGLNEATIKTRLYRGLKDTRKHLFGGDIIEK